MFINLAYALTGRYRGGPAKTAIVSSALMGTISGSPIANVVTTGTFTIPLMKSTGYSADMAGAVEAVSSTGGMIMPPVMGAAAFIMAQYLGVPYVKVAYAAAIPALLYYLCVFFIVDMEAAKKGLMGVSPEDLPKVGDSVKRSGAMILPVVLLVVLILRGMSPTQSVVWSIMLALAASMVSPETRPNLKKIVKALEDGARNSISVAVSCACAGLIVGVISLTGIGVRFSSSLIELSRHFSRLTISCSCIQRHCIDYSRHGNAGYSGVHNPGSVECAGTDKAWSYTYSCTHVHILFQCNRMHNSACGINRIRGCGSFGR